MAKFIGMLIKKVPFQFDSDKNIPCSGSMKDYPAEIQDILLKEVEVFDEVNPVVEFCFSIEPVLVDFRDEVNSLESFLSFTPAFTYRSFVMYFVTAVDSFPAIVAGVRFESGKIRYVLYTLSGNRVEADSSMVKPWDVSFDKYQGMKERLLSVVK